ncbi:MAG: UV DNA damage repair endonuclease UvsE [Planctomycetota bacterium]|nr:UV DNA damage repair endonuclease UvsE [Planctomycetaceae bacterium]MDQ3329883.1 UV DNA damage repair endonuclease UvsE [Planctomycetota bacterium]
MPLNRPRLGLCCIFAEQPIAFRKTTAAYIGRQSRKGALDKLSDIAAQNAVALRQALEFCRANGIGSFRINNEVLPLRTHPQLGYSPLKLRGGKHIVAAFREAGAFAAENDLRTLFHPDQYVVLNSPNSAVVENAKSELEHLAELAEWTHADVLIVHGGGAYGEKDAALDRLAANIESLPTEVRSRLVIENDERVFTPADLLPVCRATGVPFVYDVHHHRCNADGLTVEAATEAAVATWGDREPLFHISSPLEGWMGPKPSRHHDYIDLADFPDCWKGRKVTVEVEAKAKELAVLRLMGQLKMVEV